MAIEGLILKPGRGTLPSSKFGVWLLPSAASAFRPLFLTLAPIPNSWLHVLDTYHHVFNLISMMGLQFPFSACGHTEDSSKSQCIDKSTVCSATSLTGTLPIYEYKVFHQHHFLEDVIEQAFQVT